MSTDPSGSSLSLPRIARERFHRVVLKISGESLGPADERGISPEEVTKIAHEVAAAAKLGVEIGIVCGGGNILRGATFSQQESPVQQATAHQMGMLATVMNGLALQDALEQAGCGVRLLSAIRMDEVAEPYIPRRARRHLEKKKIVILAGGTGLPFVTTDTAAALRALDLGAEVLLKATKVDGVYSDDPMKNPHAILYNHLSYRQVQHQNLQVMDGAAIALCMEHRLPILVFNFKQKGNIQKAVNGQTVGTLVDEREPSAK